MPPPGAPRLVVVASTRAAECLRPALDRAIGARSTVWYTPPSSALERPIPVRAAELLGRLPFDTAEAGGGEPRIVGVGAAALLAFETAAQLLAKRRPPAGLALVDPPPIPPGSAQPGYRPPLVDLGGLLVLTAARTPLGAGGRPCRPDPRLEWVAQYRHAPHLVRLEGESFDLHDEDRYPPESAEAIAAAVAGW